MKKTTIISDLDGTLYPKSNGLTRQIDNLADSFLSSATGMSKNQLIRLEEIYPNILDALKVLQIPKKTYYTNVHNKLDYSVLRPNTEMNNLLASMKLNLFVVSLSPAEHIKRVLSLLQLENLVTGAFSIVQEHTSNKGSCYKKIINQYKLSEDEVCVVGDNYLLDIEPAKRLNLSAALISHPTHIYTPSFTDFHQFLQSRLFF